MRSLFILILSIFITDFAMANNLLCENLFQEHQVSKVTEPVEIKPIFKEGDRLKRVHLDLTFEYAKTYDPKSFEKKSDFETLMQKKVSELLSMMALNSERFTEKAFEKGELYLSFPIGEVVPGHSITEQKISARYLWDQRDQVYKLVSTRLFNFNNGKDGEGLKLSDRPMVSSMHRLSQADFILRNETEVFQGQRELIDTTLVDESVVKRNPDELSARDNVKILQMENKENVNVVIPALIGGSILPLLNKWLPRVEKLTPEELIVIGQKESPKPLTMTYYKRELTQGLAENSMKYLLKSPMRILSGIIMVISVPLAFNYMGISNHGVTEYKAGFGGAEVKAELQISNDAMRSFLTESGARSIKEFLDSVDSSWASHDKKMKDQLNPKAGLDAKSIGKLENFAEIVQSHSLKSKGLEYLIIPLKNPNEMIVIGYFQGTRKILMSHWAMSSQMVVSDVVVDQSDSPYVFELLKSLIERNGK